MSIFETIKKRRTIVPALFNNESVKRSDIEQLLEAANWAPTHRRTEPWRFKVVQGQVKDDLGLFLAKKYKVIAKKFSRVKQAKIMEKMNQSSAVILICMQRDPNESLPEWEEIAATAMSVQNLWLMATELGLGGYWSSPKMINYMHEFL
ncbi:MAG: nitroreductase, partial [Bacteroidia bacterium]|nr:nitroreductase [Bacteroidia bacterium]